MKESLRKWMLLFPAAIVCSLASVSDVYAQIDDKLITQEIQYDDGDGGGRFKFLIGFARDIDKTSTYITTKSFPLDMSGAKKGKLTLRFVPNDLKLRRGHQVVVRADCHNPMPNMRLSPTSDAEYVYEKGGRYSGRIVFDLVKNGSGQLNIGYDVIREGQTDKRCSKEITLQYHITGMPDEEGEACNNALAAFNLRKADSENELVKMLREFPDAPCKGDINERIAQIRDFKAAQAATSDCKKARELCERYQRQYSGNAFFAAEINQILAKCPPPPAVQPPRNQPPPPEVNPAKTAWDKIKNSREAGDFRQYIGQFSSDHKAGEFVAAARKKLTQLAPMEIRETRISDYEREYEIINAIRPRYKDMSPAYGLTVDATVLATENKIKVTLKAGDYLLRIVDETGKDTTIRISNVFSAVMSSINEGQGYFVKISGGRAPYTLELEDIESGKVIPLRTGLRTDTAVIRITELTEKNLNKQYRVRLNSSGAAEPLDLGVIDNKPKDDSAATIIVWLSGLLILTLALYLLVVFLRQRKTTKTPANAFGRTTG